ncbi:6-bladed beta-propeller, partial [Tannerella forsythia]
MQNLGIAYMCLIITSCTFNNKQEKKTAEELSFFSVNNSDVKSETELPLSQLLESLEIIPLENKDEAFSKIGVIYISDNYIGCQPYDQSPYKLFDRKGKFIGDIGAIGQGPGEYRNVYFSQINEKKERIYIVSHNAKKILTYDLKGIFLENEC